MQNQEPAKPTTPAPIAMMDVDSSQIESIGYDSPSKTLAVKFKAGSGSKLYHYHDVPIEAWTSFRTAKSIGSHHAMSIKGKYAFTKQ